MQSIGVPFPLSPEVKFFVKSIFKLCSLYSKTLTIDVVKWHPFPPGMWIRNDLIQIQVSSWIRIRIKVKKSHNFRKSQKKYFFFKYEPKSATSDKQYLFF